MIYQGKEVEILGEKTILGEKIAWVKVQETGEFLQVPAQDIESANESFSLPHLRFITIAAKIKDEIAQKNILAPYESSLIPLPHQILVLEKVMKSTQNRFLLADEVGMGKTIEAGLVLKELKMRGDVNRILVIVPKSAMMQWQSELKDHFNEIFHIYDSQLINSLSRTFANINAEGDQSFNFWEQHNQIIVSTDALKPLEIRKGWTNERVDEYNQFRMEAVLNADFDMVIIDEVHKMGGSSPTVSRYQLAQALCDVVPNALLLSATPHRGKTDHFRRVLQLLDPEAFDGEGLPALEELEPYVIRTEKRLAVNYEGEKLFNERETTKVEVPYDPDLHKKQMALYHAVTNYVKSGFNASVNSNNRSLGLIMVLFQRLVSSSTAAILSAMQNRLARLQSGEADDVSSIIEDELDSAESAQELEYDQIHNSEENTAWNLDEMEMLENLIFQAKSCLNTELDAKAEYFIKKYEELRTLKNDPDLKVLIFTEFRSTQSMLKKVLEERGYRCSTINGSQGLDERKRALGDFKGQNQLLIATDAAGESLNMQFCHVVFNYDLPWNPMVIEQRIGRVDRIGQKNKVKAFNMLLDNSVDHRVYEVIEEKLNAILSQLGIDKTSDVLDSTLDIKEVNNLYLKSLLDPNHFEAEGDKWLDSIHDKLRDYQTTEAILPEVNEEEIEYKSSADVVYSPLPVWMEDLIQQYCSIREGSISKNLEGHLNIQVDDVNLTATFDAEEAVNDPNLTHLTLQHPFVQTILERIPAFNPEVGIPLIEPKDQNIEHGIWSLWRIEALNKIDHKVAYKPFFLSDSGKNFKALANEIWTQLITQGSKYQFEGVTTVPTVIDKHNKQQELLEPQLMEVYQGLKQTVEKNLSAKYEKHQNSFEYQKSRIEKIGIENIRQSRLKKLTEEFEQWKQSFDDNKSIIPDVKHIISIRLDG